MSCGRPPRGCCWGGGPWGGVSPFQFPASSQDDSAAGLEREPQTGGGCSCAEGEAAAGRGPGGRCPELCSWSPSPTCPPLGSDPGHYWRNSSPEPSAWPLWELPSVLC